jgi:phosphoglycolate phosphatase-like HAD superfamily hydrolase
MTIDAQAGRNARIKTIIVTTGSNTPQEIRKERPWRVINKINGLLKIL